MAFIDYIIALRRSLGYMATVFSFFIIYLVILIYTGANVVLIAYLGLLYLLFVMIEVFYSIFQELFKGGKKKKNGR